MAACQCCVLVWATALAAPSTRSIYTLYTPHTLHYIHHHHNICSNSMGNFHATRKCGCVFCENPIRLVICCDIGLTLASVHAGIRWPGTWCQMTNVHLMKHECDIMTESWPNHDKDYLLLMSWHQSVHLVNMHEWLHPTYHMVIPLQLEQF